MKKVVVTVLILALLGGGGYGAYYYFYLRNQPESADRVSSTSEDAVHVDSVAMITGIGSGNGLTERYGGETVAQATLEVKLASDRKVEECYVKEGDEVKEGDKLFIYDTQESEDKLAQTQIDIERAQGEIETSKRAITENERMRNQAAEEDKLTYTTAILQEENSIKQKEYDIKQKEREITKLQEEIDNAVVTAEMAGIIQSIKDPESSEASYGYGYGGDESSAYITILAAGDFRIEGKMNEQNMMGITEGMPMIVFSRIDENMRWYGTVSEIDTSPVEENQNNYYYGDSGADSSTYKFYVELDSSEGLILGQHVYMEADVGQEEEKEGLWLEDYYIMEEDGTNYVWAASSSNVLEKREVALGEYDEEQMKYEITDGLDEDDYIAFPMDEYAEGQPVVYNSTDMSVPDLGAYEEPLYGDGMEGLDDAMMNEVGMEGFDDSMMNEDGMEGFDDSMMNEGGMEGFDDSMMNEGGMEGLDDSMMNEGGMEGLDDSMMNEGGMEGLDDSMMNEVGMEGSDDAVTYGDGMNVPYYDADADVYVGAEEIGGAAAGGQEIE